MKKVWYLLAFLILMPSLFLVPGIGVAGSQAAEGSGGGGAITSVATFYATANDGHLGAFNGSYTTAHNQAEANGKEDTINYLTIGQGFWSYYSMYILSRGGLFFNTASLPDNATITSATLSLYGTDNYSDTDFYVTVVRGADLNVPLVLADYGDLLDETASRGQLYTSGWVVGGYNPIPLNPTGRSEISKTGTTKFGVRSSRDISASVPSGAETVGFSSSEGGHAAKLEVTYCVPPTVTTNAASNVTDNTALLNGYLNNDGGEACSWRFEWGLTTSYGNATPWTGSITSGTYFSKDIYDLQPLTTYHFRAEAKNSASGSGWSNGVDRTFTTTQDDDSCSFEVGVEWVNHYDSEADLSNSDKNAGWFCDSLVSAGWVQQFNHGNNDAWPLNWTRDTPVWDGYDVSSVDTCDIAWFSGHGEAGLLSFNYCPTEPYSDGEPLWLISNCNNHYTSWPSDPNASPTYDEARWGDSDLEWVFLDSCDCLQNIHSGTYKGYVHFGWALNGAHLICGATNSIEDHVFGDYVAYYLLGWMPGTGYPLPVINSWYMGAKEVLYGTTLRCIGETSACLNDYIWGKGSVCSDPTVDNYLVIWDINV